MKPENILLKTKEDYTLVKIADFGLSKLIRQDSELRTVCGTSSYVAPEILDNKISKKQSPYTPKVDVWSLGVVLFAMLSGTMPFDNSYGSPVFHQITSGKYYFGARIWKTVSDEGKSVIRKMLVVDPNLRPSIDEILEIDWLQDQEMRQNAHELMGLGLAAEADTSMKDEIDSDALMNLRISDNKNRLSPPSIKRPRTTFQK